MEQSEDIKELAAALVNFQKEVPTIKKDGTNPHFQSKFASLESIITTIKPTLSSNNLAVSQFPTGDDELVTILMHQSGQYIRTTVKISPQQRTPQGVGSAITYMRRYALSAVLGLATDEDDDGNAATAAKPAAQRPKAPAKPAAPKLPADPFEAAKVMIERARSVDEVISISERADASDKLTAEQKQEIKKVAAHKVDSFDNQSQEAAA